MNNEIGKKYGRLECVAQVQGSSKSHDKRYLWKCECGNFREAYKNNVVANKNASCGCDHKERITEHPNYKHGMSNTRLFRIWWHMKKRCEFYYPGTHGSAHYLEASIKVCSEWNDDFKAFYDWAMNNGYEEGLSVDRINNNGDYEPSNCRWAAATTQANNRSNNVFLTFNGETMTAEQWGERVRISGATIRRRLGLGWNTEKALTTSISKRKKVA